MLMRELVTLAMDEIGTEAIIELPSRARLFELY